MPENVRKSVGQVVDEVADQYFASGMDAYTAGVKACIDVARAQVELFEKLPVLINGFLDRLPSSSGGDR